MILCSEDFIITMGAMHGEASSLGLFHLDSTHFLATAIATAQSRHHDDRLPAQELLARSPG